MIAKLNILVFGLLFLEIMKGLRLPQSLVNTNTPALGFKKMDDSINPDAPQT